MLSGYKLTEIEKKIEKMYKDRNILSPSDLSICNVAKLFDVNLVPSEGPQRAIWEDNNISVIFINPNQSEEKQREVFYHELAHPLLHCGDQTNMKSKSFRELQESQANQFQLYASIPFFMLKELDLPVYEDRIITVIEDVFKVPESLAKKRLEQIKRRILLSKIDKWDFMNSIDNEKEINRTMFPQLEDLFSPSDVKQFFVPKNKAKNKVYFIYNNGQPITLWYTIEFKRGDVNWSKEIKLFPIDAEFELVSSYEFENKDTDCYVYRPELKLHPSFPNDFAIQIHLLKEQLKCNDVDPYNIIRFVIPVKDLEDLLQLDIVTEKLQHHCITNI